jgi:(1->4)-alpha-D-glucan 1-alpha-D-glucosylmutase
MDIVPNHMGVLAADNAWWQDLLENGPRPRSPTSSTSTGSRRRGSSPTACCCRCWATTTASSSPRAKLKLAFEPRPAPSRRLLRAPPADRPAEYPRILAAAVRELERPASDPHQAQALRSIMEAFARLPRAHEPRARASTSAPRQGVSKGGSHLARSSRGGARRSQRAVEPLNGRADDPASFDALHELLERQAFRLAYWRVAPDEINYRRFFDINDLAALRRSTPRVRRHAPLVLELVRAGRSTALRIDHPDGLYDPRAYFERCRRVRPAAPTCVVEKIVAPFENLPEDWAVHGTTGYRFANVVNGSSSTPRREARLTAPTSVHRRAHAFAEIARRSKRLDPAHALARELTVLTSRLARIARADRTRATSPSPRCARRCRGDRALPRLPHLHRRARAARGPALHRLGDRRARAATAARPT